MGGQEWDQGACGMARGGVREVLRHGGESHEVSQVWAPSGGSLVFPPVVAPGALGLVEVL